MKYEHIKNKNVYSCFLQLLYYIFGFENHKNILFFLFMIFIINNPAVIHFHDQFQI